MGSCYSKTMPTNGQKKFLRRLKFLSQEERFCDVQVKFSDGNRKFNSLVLASLSPFFEAMLTSSMKEGLTGEVSLPTVSVEVFDAVMSYYMDGEGELDEKALYEAVDACEMMELPDLKDVCILNMKENLSVDSCVRIWQLSKKYTEDEKLVQEAFNMILENIAVVSNQEDFLRLSMTDVFKIITSDRPNLMQEGLFLDAVLKWIDSNEPEDASIKKFIGEIRLQLIRESDLLKKVYEHREILNKYKSLDKAIEMYVVNGTTTKSLKEDKRMTSSLHKVIVVCSSSWKPILHVHAWHLSQKRWYDLSVDLPEAREQFAACSAGSNIVICGGKTMDNILSDTLIYDSFANKWRRGPDLNTARFRHGCIEVNGKVYVFGGENESFLNTIEMLDIDKGKWEIIGNLATAVVNPVLMSSRQYILVVGGFVKNMDKEKSNRTSQCFAVEHKSTTILRGNDGRVIKGSFEASVLYIIRETNSIYGTKHNGIFVVRDLAQDGVPQLAEQKEDIRLSFDFYPNDNTQFVVCDDMGYLFSCSSTRQISLCGKESRKVVLPTIPCYVRDVWSGFTMFVADRSLHRI